MPAADDKATKPLPDPKDLPGLVTDQAREIEELRKSLTELLSDDGRIAQLERSVGGTVGTVREMVASLADLPQKVDGVTQKLQGSVDQFGTFTGKVAELIKQTSDLAKPSGDSAASKMLLADFDEYANLWRHSDSRINSGLNIFLVANGVVASAVVIFFRQQPQNIDATLVPIYVIGSMVLAFGLYMNGVVYASVIVSSQAKKVKYIEGMKQVRRYFTTPVRILDSYFVHEAANGEKSKKFPTEKVKTPPALMFTLYTWSGIQFGYFADALTWVIWDRVNHYAKNAPTAASPPDLGVCIFIGLVSSVIGFFLTRYITDTIKERESTW